MKKKVLFICVHNSARSQMAAALLNNQCGEYFEAKSAGLEPGTLNPLAVEVLREMEIDISKNKTQAVFDVFKSGELFAYVITDRHSRTKNERDAPCPGQDRQSDPAVLRRASLQIIAAESRVVTESSRRFDNS